MRILFYLLSTILLVITVLIISAYTVLNYNIGYFPENKTLEIQKNANLSQIIRDLENKTNLKINPLFFKISLKIMQADKKLRYGRFFFQKNKPFSYKSLIEKLINEGVLGKNITIPEGLKIIDIASILKQKMGIDSVEFCRLSQDTNFINKIGVKAKSLEGFLYPETYNISENNSPADILERMVLLFKEKIASYKDIIQKSPYSLLEIITLASIIQGEVMVLPERYLVSTVYNNRIKKNMLLQADPTIQYLLPKPRRLLNKDLLIDNPYNTYKYQGLPPGPICNPSILMIDAALNPLPETYIYMVAKGNGEHYFNSTLKDHLIDKAKFDRIRKKYYNKKN